MSQSMPWSWRADFYEAQNSMLKAETALRQCAAHLENTSSESSENALTLLLVEDIAHLHQKTMSKTEILVDVMETHNVL
jgi:hypothetical protein